MTAVDELMKHVQGRAFLADAGYDADRLHASLRAKRMKVVIRSAPRRHRKKRIDKKLYARRYLIECFFHHLKRFRAIATRYEKLDSTFSSLVTLASITLWL